MTVTNARSLEVFKRTFESVCANFNDKQSKNWGFTVLVGSASIEKCHLFFEDILKDNPSIPEAPGPFKVAAAFLVSSMFLVEFGYIPNQGGSQPTSADKNFWKTRLLFKSISVLLSQLKLSYTGKRLEKKWDVPSIHYRLDFLNFIRWCDFPSDGPINPPPPSKPTVDLVRANRLILALTLIIEACYYLSGNSLNCDVMGQTAIHTGNMDEPMHTDLFFDSVTPKVA